MLKKTLVASAVLSALALSHAALAAVSADEAAKLKTTLTPVGAERAGNKDGSIPAWDGGFAKPGMDPAAGKVAPEPFAQDKPLLRIDAKNAAQYGDKVSAGTLALLKQYPDTFHLEVYPTRRTAALSQHIYDNTFKNATNAKLTNEGLSFEGAYGGVPFPIPKDGLEVIWNHLVFPRLHMAEFVFYNWVGASNGKRSLGSKTLLRAASPYYDPDGREKWDGRYSVSKLETTEPSFKAGELLLIWDSVDPKNPRQAWQYLLGQRRVRRAPTVGYDTPDFVASGANYFDEVQGFYGAPDRYQWKLIGKKEVYIPYNNNAFVNLKTDEAFSQYHLNSSKLRWELHRVWVVEATLAPGKRHVCPKRTFYIDEDNWTISLVDEYDAAGKLWRTIHSIPYIMPSIPLTFANSVMVFNLSARTYSAIQSINEGSVKAIKPKPMSFFSPDTLGAEGIR